MKVLLTGCTGFIGSNIAKGLLEQGHVVYATHRNSSSFNKCLEFKEKINWINTESSDWKEQVEDFKPDQLIHAAWSGIEAENRNNWEIQLQNFWLSKEYFDLAKKIGIKKIISLGSQAEYGTYSFTSSEQTVPQPNDAYGAIKSLTANYLRNLFENTETEWYWIRVYSVFGEHENRRWLIPSVISKLLKNESIQLTSCEQQYNYLYIEDFVSQLLSIVKYRENKSGIYNICNSESIVLSSLLLKIAQLMEVSLDLLQFGALSQRIGHTMFISGDNKKFINSFTGLKSNPVGLENGLRKTINYHKNTK